MPMEKTWDGFEPCLAYAVSFSSIDSSKARLTSQKETAFVALHEDPTSELLRDYVDTGMD